MNEYDDLEHTTVILNMICGLTSTTTKIPAPPDVFDEDNLDDYVDNFND